MEKTTDPLYDISNIYLLHDIQHTYLLKRLVTCFPEPRLLPLSFSSYIDYLKLVKDSVFISCYVKDFLDLSGPIWSEWNQYYRSDNAEDVL